MATIIRPPCDEGVILAGGPSASARSGRWTLVAAILGSSMAFLDGTVVTVALPAIAIDLSATVAQLQWVVDSATAAGAALLPLIAIMFVVGTVFGDRLRVRLADRPLPEAVRSAILAQRDKWAGAEVPPTVDPSLRIAIRRDISESFVAGFRVAMFVSAVLALLAAASAAALVRPAGKR